MYLQFKGKRLAALLGDLRNVVERRNSLPALSNVLIESIDAGRVRLTATDLDHTLQIETPHEGLFDGKFCVSLDKLLGLAKALPDADLTIHAQDNGWAEVKSDSGKYKVMGIAPESYPITEKAEAQSYEVEASDLFLALSEVALHQSKDEHEKYALRSVLLELNGSLKCVATSGRSMGVCEVKPEQPFLAGGVASWLLPAKAVSALRNAFAASGKILCWASDNLLCFRQGDMLLTSRRPTQTFPNYEMILKSPATAAIEIDREGLARALDVLACFAQESEGTYSTFKSAAFTFGPQGLTLKAKSHDGEEATEEIDAKVAEPFDASIELFLFRSMLKQAGPDSTLRADSGKAPWFLTAESERRKTTHVIQPLMR